MSNEIDAEEQRTEVALFRYTLILPLLRGEYEPGSKGRLRQQIAAAYHQIPRSGRRSVSAPTLGRWERRYNQAGFDGLKPKSRSDRGQPRTISPETLDRAEALKRQQPRRSSRSIVKALSMDSTQPIPEETIAPRTLRRQLALRDATTAQLLSEQRPKPYRRFERTHFGDLWQGDAMHGPKLPDPANPDRQRQVFLFAFLDDHTRLIPHAQFYWNEQLPRLEDCFKRAMLRYGRPLAIYVDHRARSTPPTSSTPSAPSSAFSASWARPTTPRAGARSNASFSSSSPTSSQNWPHLRSIRCPCSTSPYWPG